MYVCKNPYYDYANMTLDQVVEAFMADQGSKV